MAAARELTITIAASSASRYKPRSWLGPVCVAFMTEQIVERILEQSAEWRYWFSLRAACRVGKLFGLTGESHWEMTIDRLGFARFAVWPSYELAHLCCPGCWPRLRPCPFELDDWSAQWFAQLSKRGIPIEVFPTHSTPGCRVTPAEFFEDLEAIRSERIRSRQEPDPTPEPWLLAGSRPSR